MNESSHIYSIHPRRLAPLAIRLLVGLAILAFVFSRGADLNQVSQIIKNANPAHILLVLLIAIAGEILTACKWTLLIQYIGGKLPLLDGVRASFIGMFYNNFLPGSVGGDIVRVLLVARHAGGKARALASAFMQRNTGLAGLFVIGIPAAFLWPVRLELPNEFQLTRLEWLRDCRFWLLTAVVGYGAVNLALFSRQTYSFIWNIFQRTAGHPDQPSAIRQSRKSLLLTPLTYLFQKLRRFHTELHGFRYWLTAPLVISAITQLIDIFMVWNLSQALSVPIPFHILLVAVPMVTLANLIPITINGIGLREAMYVALLTASDSVMPSQAVALSLMHFAIIITLSAIGGLWQWKFSGQA